MYVSIVHSELREDVRLYFESEFNVGAGDDVHFSKTVRVDDRTLLAEFDALLATNGGKRGAAMKALAVKYKCTERHIRRRINGKKSA